MNESKELHSTVICTQGGRILFVRKEAPEWSLPGGKIEPGEEHLEAARRELSEETTLQLSSAKFIGHYVYQSEEHYLYQMPVEPTIVPHPSDEIVECRWFTPSELELVNVKPNNLDLISRAERFLRNRN
ncbi:NUDIX domain-containing protein [Pseudomonas tructae]|uniref:NUDIX domain-containing protein n=1 Tax=Pseudomonas tructae TaxID=2518644 RepID=A0A411MJ01_9PSED|nr:NUDIX domain-containing protein [Pseudomonas tructae]QBF26771.1 NUDIX domain-containing protein [Pseudomonas tructae]